MDEVDRAIAAVRKQFGETSISSPGAAAATAVTPVVPEKNLLAIDKKCVYLRIFMYNLCALSYFTVRFFIYLFLNMFLHAELCSIHRLFHRRPEIPPFISLCLSLLGSHWLIWR